LPERIDVAGETPR